MFADCRSGYCKGFCQVLHPRGPCSQSGQDGPSGGTTQCEIDSVESRNSIINHIVNI